MDEQGMRRRNIAPSKRASATQELKLNSTSIKLAAVQQEAKISESDDFWNERLCKVDLPFLNRSCYCRYVN